MQDQTSLILSVETDEMHELAVKKLRVTSKTAYGKSVPKASRPNSALIPIDTMDMPVGSKASMLLDHAHRAHI